MAGDHYEFSKVPSFPHKRVTQTHAQSLTLKQIACVNDTTQRLFAHVGGRQISQHTKLMLYLAIVVYLYIVIKREIRH